MEPRAEPGVVEIVDVALGAGVGLWRLGWRAGRPLRVAAGAVLHGAAAVGEQVRPGTAAALGDRGRRARADLERRADAALRFVTRQVVDLVVTTVDLTELVRRHVDLDAVAAELDVDAVVARADLDAIVDRLDLDAIVATVDLDAIIARIDLDAVVATVDLEPIIARVDVDGVVRTVDLDAIVDRLDLDALAGRIDVAAIVARVDPNPVVAVVDFDAALARIDLVGIARYVIDAIDLPEIVRDSTGTLSSDAVRAVRAQGLAADDLVAGVFDRLLRRRGARAPVTP